MNDRHACLRESELRALVDDEARASEREAWSAHLAGCAACRARYEQVRAAAEQAAALMSRLDTAAAVPDTTLAYRRLRTQRPGFDLSPTKGAPLMQRITGIPRRAAVVTVAIVALMVSVIAFAPVGTLAQDVLNRFRVQQFAAITIPMDTLQQFSGMAQTMPPQAKAQVASELKGMGSFSTTLSPQSLHQAASVADARAHLGGNLAVPSDLPAPFNGAQPKIFLGDAGSAQVTIDVAKVQQAASMLGLRINGLPDPAQTPQVTLSLNVPDSAVLDYQAGDKHLVVGQMESPTLDVPSTVNMDELRDSILMMPGLPPDLVSQLRAVHDWKNTLIIPVPSDATTSQKQVCNAQALLIESKDGAAVLWQEDGILHAVGGQGLSGSEVMSVANGLQ